MGAYVPPAGRYRASVSAGTVVLALVLGAVLGAWHARSVPRVVPAPPLPAPPAQFLVPPDRRPLPPGTRFAWTPGWHGARERG